MIFVIHIWISVLIIPDTKKYSIVLCYCIQGWPTLPHLLPWLSFFPSSLRSSSVVWWDNPNPLFKLSAKNSKTQNPKIQNMQFYIRGPIRKLFEIRNRTIQYTIYEKNKYKIKKMCSFTTGAHSLRCRWADCWFTRCGMQPQLPGSSSTEKLSGGWSTSWWW